MVSAHGDLAVYMSMFVNNNFFMDSFHWSLKNGPEVHQQDF